MKTELTGTEKFWYYTVCIFTLGHLYFVKLAAKKAQYEIQADTMKNTYIMNQHNV
jgi:hypothetical protein